MKSCGFFPPVSVAGAALCCWLAGAAMAAPSKYMGDFDFIAGTVAKQGATVKSKKIDWKGACARLKPKFEQCASDAEHVKNVAELLAVLQDNHTGLTADTSREGVPSKWDGLYGGGLWIGWDNGRFVLQGMMEGHPGAKEVPPGSTLIQIQEQPAWLVMEREYRRIAQYEGISSAHSLFGSMGNRMLPFGSRKGLDLVFLKPGGEIAKISVATFGPGGKAFDPVAATLPAGVAWKEGACSGMLSLPWCAKVGYVRITGSMNAATVKQFHLAFDALQGMEALVLEGRNMGGGSDSSAWEIAGRLFRKATPNGKNGKIAPSGSWQFDGPVVFLQDETMVSAAETFTWAVCESERVISVGRPTGGWAVIPQEFRCPSGFVSFRLGVTDRGTPVRGIKTEGTGWQPDVKIPRGPVYLAQPDAVREMGLRVLQTLHAGMARKDTLSLFQMLMSGKTEEFTRTVRSADGKLKDLPAEDLARAAFKDFSDTMQMESALLSQQEVLVPETVRAAARWADLSLRAPDRRPVFSPAESWKEFVAEAAAQRELLALADAAMQLPERIRETWQKRHAATRIAKWLLPHAPRLRPDQ